MTAPDWLTARPIAHRGLHDLAQSVVENTPSAARAAIAAGYAIECDVQLSADGEAMVFHDLTLDRLMKEPGRLGDLTAERIGQAQYKAGGDRILTLPAFLGVIGGRVPLVLEIKSVFDGDMRLAERAAAVLRGYSGPVAVKSFDPAIVAHLRRQRALLGLHERPLGVVAQAQYNYHEWDRMPPERKHYLSNFLHFEETRPEFLSYHVKDMPSAVPYLLRRGLGLPVMAWTVRTPEQRALANQNADQIVFEGFLA